MSWPQAAAETLRDKLNNPSRIAGNRNHWKRSVLTRLPSLLTRPLRPVSTVLCSSDFTPPAAFSGASRSGNHQVVRLARA